MKDDSVKKLEGIVEEALPGTSFRVRTSDGKEVLAHLSGKMRMYYIKIEINSFLMFIIFHIIIYAQHTSFYPLLR